MKFLCDFLSGTFTMDNEQVGKYIRLLCLQHQKGKLSEKDMLSICKAYDVEIWDKFKVEDGLYYNERMFNETIRRQKFSESRRNNAKSPKKESTSEAYAKHMETETENRTITINEDINIDFEWFWNEYDKKVGDKQKLKKKWNKLTDDERQNAMNYLDLYKQSVPDKQFQLILYKHFFSEQYNIPIDSIEVEFFIVKRKVMDWDDEKILSPHQAYRVQTFVPASGKIKVTKAKEALNNFIKKCFNTSGEIREEEYPKVVSKWNCLYCPFKEDKNNCGEGIIF